MDNYYFLSRSPATPTLLSISLSHLQNVKSSCGSLWLKVIPSQSSSKVLGGGGVVVDDGSLHHQQGAEDKPTNQLKHSQCRVGLTGLKKAPL